MYRGIIIGHSFVKGFAEHLARQNGGVPMSDARVAEALKVSDGVGAVRLFGVSGARVLGNFTLPDLTLNTIQPNFAILNIGGNDLTQPTSPHDQGMLAQAIVAMANNLIINYGVVEVHICQIIDRMEGLAGITCNEYCDAAYAVNKHIMGLCEAHPYMHFQVMKGFCRNSPESWIRPVWLRDETSDVSSDDDASNDPTTTTAEPDQPTGDNPVRPVGDPDLSPTLAALIQSQQSMVTQIQVLTATDTQLVAQRNFTDPPAAANNVGTAPLAGISNPAGDDPVQNPVPGPSSTANPQSDASVLNSGSAKMSNGWHVCNHEGNPVMTSITGAALHAH